MTEPFERVIRDHPAVEDALEALAGLKGPELTSVLLELFRRRTAVPSALPALQRQNRFTRPSPIPYQAIRWAEDRVLEALPEWVELVTLAPSTVLGAHVALGGSSQDRLISTIRRTEMAADPTLGLALEAAVRRGTDPRDYTLAALQRVSRAQAFDSPHSFGHFTLFGMVTTGRDRGRLGFERWSAIEHLRIMIDAVRRGDGRRIEVRVIDPGAHHPVFEAVRASLGDEVPVDRSDATLGSYYETARFGVTAEFGGERLDVGDGGFVSWMAQMRSDRKERLCISGLGIDRIATAETSRSHASPSEK